MTHNVQNVNGTQNIRCRWQTFSLSHSQRHRHNSFVKFVFQFHSILKLQMLRHFSVYKLENGEIMNFNSIFVERNELFSRNALHTEHGLRIPTLIHRSS